MTVIILAVRPSRQREPFSVLPQPVAMPLPFREKLARWLPTAGGWAWLWRVETIVFGKRQPVNVFTEVVSWRDSPDLQPSNFSLGTPTFSDGNGWKAWLLETNEMQELREKFGQWSTIRRMARPRMSTSDGVISRIYVGAPIVIAGSTNQVGFSLGCLAQVRPGFADLTVDLEFSEAVTNRWTSSDTHLMEDPMAIRTNIDVGVRLRIPDGVGVFMLGGGEPAEGGKHIGILFDPLRPKI